MTDYDCLAVLEEVKAKHPHETEFLQAVEECVHAVAPVVNTQARLDALRMLMDPERIIIFRVPWHDDQGNLQVNRAYRVQFSSTLGPYKGGMRFHPTVNLSILKFLGFEQIFKNALTGVGMGGGKGGSDFDPKGKSDAEVKRFCQSLMTELVNHIGPQTDVPAGDIGVGGREIGYLFGQYKRLANRTDGVLTGKGPLWGGSNIRPEATGYGCCYIAREALGDLSGKQCAVSGSGNVAQYCMQKLLQMNAKPISCSDSAGCLVKPAGFTHEDLQQIMHLKNQLRGRLSTLSLEGAEFHPGKKSWEVVTNVDCAFPCATQNEITKSDAEHLVKEGCSSVFEGANMPCDREAIGVWKQHQVVYIPGKASNAGGVAVSGLEMAQNAARLTWTSEKVDTELQQIMARIYQNISRAAEEAGSPGDLEVGANVAGFLEVAQAMDELGTL
jgi:glutamate dehydrogenase (NADP+)